MDAQTQLAVLSERVRALEERCSKLVTQDQFSPVQRLVYGVTGMALVAIFGALIAMALRGHP